MRQPSHVVWSEGMHLAQHHFQAQRRFAEETIHFALGHLFFEPWGLTGCELDAEALRNGTVALLHARGIMPDGLAFHFARDAATTGASPCPPPRPIREHFSPLQESLVVHLGVPGYRAGAANCAPAANGNGNGNGGAGTHPAAETAEAAADALGDALRYVAEPRAMVDETTGRDERMVALGRPAFRLVFGGELAEAETEADAAGAAAPPALVTLPLARVRRDVAGQLVYDPAFVPPILEVGASEGLMASMRRLLEMLEAASASMAAGGPGEAGEVAAAEVASLWLRHTVHASLAPLRHLVHVRHVHPERLYVELARLAGALCTFALDGDARAVPAYDHRHLGPCFAALERQVRARLELAAPTTCLRVPLAPLAGHAAFYTGQVRDPRAFGRTARWFLALRSTGPAAYLMMEAPQLVKACAGGEWIVKLVAHAMSGMPVAHLQVPPPAISPRGDTVYFEIGHDPVRGADPERKCWDLVGRTGEIGLYVPEALGATYRELLVLVEG